MRQLIFAFVACVECSCRSRESLYVLHVISRSWLVFICFTYFYHTHALTYHSPISLFFALYIIFIRMEIALLQNAFF